MSQEQLVKRLTRFYREAGAEISSVPPVWTPGKPRPFRQLQPVLASLVLIVLAVGLAVTLRIVHDQAENKVRLVPPPSASPSPSPAPSPSPSATPSPSWVARHVSFGQVTAMSLDASAIFALYAPPRDSGGFNPAQFRLARVDRSTGALITAGPFPNAWELARTAGGLWVAAGAELWAPGSDTQWLTLVDPVTLKVKQRVRLPGSPDTGIPSDPHLAATSSLMWLGYGHALYRLDPSTGRVLSTQASPGTVTSISIDPSGHRLYTAIVPAQTGTAQVVEWDASTGGRIGSAPTGGGDLGGAHVAAAPGGVWISYATGMMGAVERRADPSLSLVAGPEGGHTNSIRAFVGGGALWLVDGAGRVTCAELRTGAAAASSQEVQPTAVVADANGSFLGDAEGVGFLRPDPSCPR